MSLHDGAVIFKDVCKTYYLYQNQWQMVKHALGLKNRKKIQEFHALKNINLTVNKGERIGLVGRNGAGKSTLLKLITGNFSQTSGCININGKVQALMSTGLGFHPEFTGLDNIKASLLYNGLSSKEFEIAIDEIIDFVELGDFLNQPFKTYSLGMQSRLYFAVATAIQPEILIVDEVLGAGDAYFSAKSADRMKRLTNSGCTLILVSHSTQQVLQFCEKAYWIESGEIVMDGEAIDIIKAYEAYTKKLELESSLKKASTIAINTNSIIQSTWLRKKLLNEILVTHNKKAIILSDEKGKSEKSIISRWPSHDDRLIINEVRLLNVAGQIVNEINSNDELNIEISIIAKETGCYDIYFVILLFTEDGKWLTRHCSDKIVVNLDKNENYLASLQYEKVLLGNGKYIFSAAIYKIFDLNDLGSALYYDLLSRSFEFKVISQYQDDSTIFHHPSQWIFQKEDHSSSTIPHLIECSPL